MATDEEFRDMAREKHTVADGIAFDHMPIVLHEDVDPEIGECYGAYVQAWVWVEIPPRISEEED